MSDFLNPIKPCVRELRTYTLTPERATVKLNQNENPWDAPERIKAESLRRLGGRAWSRYPDFAPASLHERLAHFTGWRANGIVAGNGSNELIQALLMVTITEGFEELLKRDILVRDVSGYPMLRDYFRVSVGTPHENDLLLAALREIFD